jgi:hypothetical protein
MFLLCKDDVTRKDGTFTVNHPFMITLQNRLYAFVAFPTQELDEYKGLDIGITEKSNLKESRYLYVFSARADINRLFSENRRSRTRAKNMVDIAQIRPDLS